MPKELPPGFDNIQFPTEAKNPFAPEKPSAPIQQNTSCVTRSGGGAVWPTRHQAAYRRKTDAVARFGVGGMSEVRPVGKKKYVAGREKKEPKWPCFVSSSSEIYL